jgi:hypothetical protein
MKIKTVHRRSAPPSVILLAPLLAPTGPYPKCDLVSYFSFLPNDGLWLALEAEAKGVAPADVAESSVVWLHSQMAFTHP